MNSISLFLTGVILMTSPSLLLAQNVTIPDAIFKAILVADVNINTNGDGEIQVAEATNFTGSINVYNAGISDLSGIEAFTALTSLDCGNNNLGNIDVSANTALTILYCNNSQLTALDVTNNTALTELSCYQNLLTGINLSNNTALLRFFAFGNLLTSLDLSASTMLTRLFCQNNQLTTLNVKNGNNSNFTHFNATVNPNLACIEVDTVAYSNTYWDHIDAGAVFSVNCFTNIATQGKTDATIQAYPNPSQGILFIENIPNDSRVELYNTLGQLIQTQDFNQQEKVQINLPVSLGIYILTVVSPLQQYSLRIERN